MTSSANWDDRFHQAAKDGNLDLLSKANRKDANTRDEDGMTPTIWAAYYGNLAALRKIIERGGNPDKCDYLGNTSLHCAAARGHYDCVSFLINFGSNLWAMDNDHRTAMDIASLNDRTDIVKLLDQARAEEKQRNPKSARKLQEAAVLDADARIKDFDKRQKKLQERMKVEEATTKRAGTKDPSRSGNFISKTISKIGKDSKKYDDPNETLRSVPVLTSRDGQALLLQKEQRNNNSQFGRQRFTDTSSLASDRTYTTDSGYGDYDTAPGHFPIRSGLPGLNRAFIKRIQPIAADSWNSIATHTDKTISEEDDTDSAHGESVPRSQSAIDSVGSAGSFAHRNEWDGCDLSEDDEEDHEEVEDLKLFLAGNGLGKFYPLFQKERIDDMETLLLLTDSDLEKIGLELGPRKRIMQAMLKFKADIEAPEEVADSRL